MKLLILYTEIARYTVACLEAFVREHPDVEIHLVRWPVNDEAPFQFQFNSHFKIYERKDFTTEKLIELSEKINPTAIICSGWRDKDYLRVSKRWKKKIPVILVMDNKWMGTFKQQIARMVSSFSILRRFNLVWVPGEQQKKYALRLGFPSAKIKTGFYSADTDFFKKHSADSFKSKSHKMPHRFIYAGRYYDFKGVEEMWQAFIKWKSTSENDWELWCVGNGNCVAPEHSAIKHFGFLQPEKIVELMKDAGVFILPSRIEPWGVVVHEFATAGFPLLLSDQVGAADVFLQDGKNGFSFPAKDVEGMITSFKSIAALSDEKIFRMGQHSVELSKSISPRTWSETLFELMTTKI